MAHHQDGSAGTVGTQARILVQVGAERADHADRFERAPLRNMCHALTAQQPERAVVESFDPCHVGACLLPVRQCAVIVATEVAPQSLSVHLSHHGTKAVREHPGVRDRELGGGKCRLIEQEESVGAGRKEQALCQRRPTAPLTRQKHAWCRRLPRCFASMDSARWLCRAALRLQSSRTYARDARNEGTFSLPARAYEFVPIFQYQVHQMSKGDQNSIFCSASLNCVFQLPSRVHSMLSTYIHLRVGLPCKAVASFVQCCLSGQLCV
eukprot:4970707-Prymnesium_polylepis.1